MPRKARLDARPACPDLAGSRLSSRWRAGSCDGGRCVRAAGNDHRRQAPPGDRPTEE